MHKCHSKTQSCRCTVATVVVFYSDMRTQQVVMQSTCIRRYLRILNYFHRQMFCPEKTRLDHVRNAHIRTEANMYPMTEITMKKRFRWFGHVQRRDKDETTRNILQMTVYENRNRSKPKPRWRDLGERVHG